MIAKITVHAATRGAALQMLDRALAQTEVAGSVTNLAFLRRLATEPRFRVGDVDTGLIAAGGEDLLSDPQPCSRTKALAALGAAGLHSSGDHLQGFTLWAPLKRRADVTWKDQTVSAQIEVTGPGRFVVNAEDNTHRLEMMGSAWSIDGARVPARVVVTGDLVSVFWGNGYTFVRQDPLARGGNVGPSGNVIEAPMPGLLKSVSVRAGQTVRAGDRLAVLEAMKMEHKLLANRDGVVADVLAAEGDQVEAGAALIRLEEDGDD
jgi:3-methylcrotonyl-CoA carboxylase alpha subunit